MASVKELTDSVQQDVAKVWPHTGRIWPGVDFSDHQVLLSDGSTTYALDAKGMKPVSAQDLKQNKIDIPSPDSFDVVTWQGKPALIIRPAKDLGAGQKADPTGLTAREPAYSFGLASHEQFHPYVQNAPKSPWTSLQKLEKSAGDRTELYPLKPEPRIARAMVYNSLLSALQQPKERDAFLAEAAYWNTKWTKNYPEDAEGQEATDLLEGTAKYFEQSAIAMAAVDRPGDPAQVRAYLAKTLKPMKVASKGIEPYAIGTVALLNADAKGLDVKESLTTEPTTPLAALLKGVKPAGSQSAPADVTRGIEQGVQASNKELGPLIEPFVADVQDKSKSVLMLPVESVSGSVGGKGFYTTEELPISITPKARATFKSKTGTVRVDGATVGEIDEDDKGYFAVPLDLDDADAALDGTRLTLKAEGLSGTVTVKAATNDGQQFLYAQ
ncbi:hypothetical protein DY218_02435 [Streptomyces triticagri]|uniref:Uncharacterized protein n=1 Tax=Streptomyces triticagri TaxID=2293568 RepID=A0A372MBG9_9ACTN|nr:hypothetical protein DY218_02435 [Streptomyces triticagri]